MRSCPRRVYQWEEREPLRPLSHASAQRNSAGPCLRGGKGVKVFRYPLLPAVFALLFWWADPFPGSALLSLLILGMGVWGGGQDLVYQKKLLLLLREELGLPL